MPTHDRPTPLFAPDAAILYFDAASSPVLQPIPPAPARDESARTDSTPSRSRGAGRDRRKSIRHRALEYRLWLAWWKGPEFLIQAAELVNVSEGGVLILIAEAPAEGQRLWMRLEGTDPVEDVRAVVIEAAQAGFGGYAVRLEFCEPCPPAFYQTAVKGIVLPPIP